MNIKNAELDVDFESIEAAKKLLRKKNFHQKSDRKMEFLACYATHYPYQIFAKNEKRILLMGLTIPFRIHLRYGRLHFVNQGQSHCTLVYNTYVVLLR